MLCLQRRGVAWRVVQEMTHRLLRQSERGDRGERDDEKKASGVSSSLWGVSLLVVLHFLFERGGEGGVWLLLSFRLFVLCVVCVCFTCRRHC